MAEDVAGVAGKESAGIVHGRGPQTTAEASAAEEKRREGFSEVEKEEAETRDRVAEGLGGPSDQGSVPNVGSPSDEGREDSNQDTDVDRGTTVSGTDPDEEVTP